MLSAVHSYGTDEETGARKPTDSPTGSQAASVGPGLEVRWLDSCCESQYHGSPSSPLTTPKGRKAASGPTRPHGPAPSDPDPDG